jgi:hypothetical protein
MATDALWMFAYEDGGRAHLPRPDTDATRCERLPASRWKTKYRIITDVYGFTPETWEAQVTPRSEAFTCFETVEQAQTYVMSRTIKP